VKFAKGVAEYIKKEFDEKFDGIWNVIVGKSSSILSFNALGHNFGFYGSYHTESIILF